MSRLVRTACVTVSLAPLLWVASAPPVHAEQKQEAQGEVIAKLRSYLADIESAKEYGNRAAPEFRAALQACAATVERGRQLGINPRELIDGEHGHWPFWRADEVCQAWRMWRQLTFALVEVAQAASALGVLGALEPGAVGDEVVAHIARPAQACFAAIDAAVATGAPADISLPVDAVPRTLAGARVEVCSALAQLAARFTDETKRLREAAAAALAEKYRAAGIDGDKLKIILANGEVMPLLGRGCADVVYDPKALAAATLLVQRTNPANGNQGIRKLRFRGNRLLRTEYREFSSVERAFAWCQ
jgi:hypothetical protein